MRHERHFETEQAPAVVDVTESRAASRPQDIAPRSAAESSALVAYYRDLTERGILFLDAAGRLLRAIPGQAAAGPPYWSA